MDFKHLVETNESYNEKNLKAEDKQFIDGLKYVKDEIIDCFAANYEVTEEKDADEMTTLDKIRKEIAEETLENLKAWLECDIAEAIVKIIDNYED